VRLDHPSIVAFDATKEATNLVLVIRLSTGSLARAARREPVNGGYR
jgi:hypothetical protein